MFQEHLISRRLSIGRLCVWLCLLGNLVAANLVNAGDEWRQFRGPGARGVAEAAGLPDRWSAENNIAWSQEIEGRGWSSPIVTGGRIFLTTVAREKGDPEAAKPGLYFGGDRYTPSNVVHEWQVVCLELSTGRVLWTKTVHRGLPKTPRHIKNSYASETPVTDGEHVYALFGDVGLYCLSLDGEIEWSRALPPYKTRLGWGTAASPVRHEDRLYFVSDNDEASYLAAVDKHSGKDVWRVDRTEKSNWATPYVWQNELRTEIITPGTQKVRSYDLAGKLLYEFGGSSSITIATPYSEFGMLYVSSGYVLDSKKPIFAIRPGASGDISLNADESANDSIAWCQKDAAPYNPTTMVYGELLYVLYDRGFVATYDARTGKAVHAKQRIPNGRSFTSSPWAANDRVYFLNEFGTTFVYQAGADFKLLHKNELPSDDMYMATPAIVGNKLLIRSEKKLYCIGG